MTIAERNNKLKHFITCLKCEVSGKCCDDNCSTQYDAGNMGEIIENLEAISKAIEQETVPRESYEHEYFLRKEFEIKIDKLQRQLEEQEQEQEPIDYKAQYEKFSKKAETVISQLRVDRDRLQKVIENTRNEIAELDNKVCRQFLIEDVDKEIHHAYQDCLNIIDKCIAESEE